MLTKIFLVANLCGLYAAQVEEKKSESISSLLDTTKFFLNWKSSNEKINQLFADKVNVTRHNEENTQKRKTLETKFIALRDLYDEKNWRHYDNGRVKRNARQNPADRPIYDSLLTRRTFMPSLRTILIELSLMTLSVVVLNAFENAMAQTKKTRVPNRHRYFTDTANDYHEHSFL